MNPELIPPELFELAVAWAMDTVAEGEGKGRELDKEEQETARKMGVAHPESIRIVAGAIPMPPEGPLRQAAEHIGLGQNAEGLTLGYVLFLRRDLNGPRDYLLAHECRHVFQFEGSASLQDFISTYLGQLNTDGYRDAPWELDALNWQNRVFD